MSSGLCLCGCGQRAPIARRACPRQNVRRGDQLRFISGHNSKRAPDLTRYVVTESGCHEWTGSRDRKGYGRIQVNGRHRPAHVVAWEATHGPTPDGKHIDHRCHNHPCINEEHLRPLTPAENNRCKLRRAISDQQADEIRGSTRRAVDLAFEYQISRQYVSDIRKGRRLKPIMATLGDSS